MAAKFKTNLQEFRKKAGFKSAHAFAAHIGMPKDTYTKLEQGISAMSLLQAWEFADEFGCTIDDLAGRHFGDDDTITADERRIVDVYRSSGDTGRVVINNAVDTAVQLSEMAAAEKRERSA